MAKQIKVIKCPQCGNTKPTAIGKDHYRCDKCDTEFILDSDDVNVNVHVNHQYGQQTSNRPTISRGAWSVIIVALLFVPVILVKYCIDGVTKVARDFSTYQIFDAPATDTDQNLFSVLLPGSNQATAFYLTKQNDAVYAKFLTVATGKVIKEQIMDLPANKLGKIDYRWFKSDSTHYLIAGKNQIYKIDPRQDTITNITADICKRKPALNAGNKSVWFIPEGWGEGFTMETNLGKPLIYCPKPDLLCTEKAFNHLADESLKSPSPDAKEMVFYLFRNRESSHSSNVAQLFEVKYHFNNGAPEKRATYIEEAMNSAKYVCKPITEEQTWFSPALLFYDQRHILVSYQPSLAEDAGTCLQLLDTSGKEIWTTPFQNNKLSSISAVRTAGGFMLQIDRSNFFEISNDGKTVNSYKLP